MRKFLFVPLVFLFWSSALAQEPGIIPTDILRTRTVSSSDDQIRHATLELVYSEEGRTALANYQFLKAAGKLGRNSMSSSHVIGERKMFQMRDLSVPNSQIKYDNLEFELRAEKAGVFNIWVQVSELDNGHVRAEDVEQIRVALGVSTSGDSYDPSRGVVEINTEVFGPAPDVDGDGVLDLLIGDIQEGYDHVTGGGSIVLGFFDPNNMSGRNNADILYLDSYPGFVNLAGTRYPFDPPAQTAAHEQQHLIFATKNGSGDLSFVNEGLSEWSEVVNGFIPRTVFYFQVESERRHSLLDFRESGGDFGFDYQRAGLFTNYIAERIGVLKAGAIARANGIGAYGYYDVLAPEGLTLQNVISDFHVANILNDRSIATEYGYTTPQRSDLRITNLPVIDGSANTQTPPASGTISPGGARYVVWDSVTDIEISVTEDNGIQTLLSPIAIGFPELGQPEIVSFEAGGEGVFLDGSFETVILVLPHVYLWQPSDFNNPNAPSADYTFSANWRPFETSLTTTVYDTGAAAKINAGGNIFDALGMEPTGQKANRFEVPPGSSLIEVQIDQPYENDFQGSPIPLTAPRDFTLVVWNEDSEGRPGDEIFSLDVVDESTTGFTDFIFHTIDLTPYAAELSNLPPVVFIGSRNVGTDLNYLLMTVSTFAGDESPSFLYDSFFASTSTSPWGSFNDFCIGACSDVDMSDYVAPIRATFAAKAQPTAIDEDRVLPIQPTLDQNYPNPFNPATSIRYSLPATQHVTITVFDMLGRKVRTLVDESRLGGPHEVRFDARSLSSGLYIYTLSTETGSYSRTMTLLK